MEERSPVLVQQTAQIVSAYVAASSLAAAEIPSLIQSVHGALASLGRVPAEAPLLPTNNKLTVAQIRKSITPDWLVSFEDGKSYKTLKRHLAARGLTLADYRAKWGLPKHYPATAPNYSSQRSALAKSVGLGQLGGKRKRSAADVSKARSRK